MKQKKLLARALVAAAVAFSGKSLGQERTISFEEPAPEVKTVEPARPEVKEREPAAKSENPEVSKPKEKVVAVSSTTPKKPAEEIEDSQEHKGLIFTLHNNHEIYDLGRIHPLGGGKGIRKQFPEKDGLSRLLVLNNNGVKTLSLEPSFTLEIKPNVQKYRGYVLNRGVIPAPHLQNIGLAAEYSRFTTFGYANEDKYSFKNNNLFTITPSAEIGFSILKPATLILYGSVGFEQVNDSEHGFSSENNANAYMNGAGMQLNIDKFSNTNPVLRISRLGIANTGTTGKNWMGYGTAKFGITEKDSNKIDLDVTPHLQYIADEARAGGTVSFDILLQASPTSIFGIAPSFRGESNFMAGSFLGEPGIELGYQMENVKISFLGAAVFEANAGKLSIPITPSGGLVLSFKN